MTLVSARIRAPVSCCQVPRPSWISIFILIRALRPTPTLTFCTISTSSLSQGLHNMITSDILYSNRKFDLCHPIESTPTCLRSLMSSRSHLLFSLRDEGVFETEELDTIVLTHIGNTAIRIFFSLPVGAAGEVRRPFAGRRHDSRCDHLHTVVAEVFGCTKQSASCLPLLPNRSAGNLIRILRQGYEFASDLRRLASQQHLSQHLRIDCYP